MSSVTVQGLYVYPVKGCRGISLQRARVTRAGLALDRRWMVVGEDGKFLSQRSHPRLCLIHTRVEGDRFVLRAASQADQELVLPFALNSGQQASVQVWRDAVQGIAFEPGSQFFSEFLGERARLVYMPDSSLRKTNPRHSVPGDVVSFADAYPLLAVSLASLADLNGRLPEDSQALPMDRFRPNLVLQGTAPFEEDDFALTQIDTVTFRRARLCERCVVTTIDQDTAQADREPLRTLARFRKWDGAVWFGSNWIPAGEGELQVGSPVELLERSPARALSEP